MSDNVFLTPEEAEMVLEGAAGRDVHDRLHKSGAREVVVKDGERPRTVLAAEQFVEVANEKVKTVFDTTASGDDFIVYLYRFYSSSRFSHLTVLNN